MNTLLAAPAHETERVDLRRDDCRGRLECIPNLFESWQSRAALAEGESPDDWLPA